MISLGAVNFFAGAGVLYAFEHSNPAGKIVLTLLVAGSTFSWTVMITKFFMVRRIKEETARFLKEFRANRRPLSVYQARKFFPGSPFFAVYMAGCKELLYHLLGSTEWDETMPLRISEADRISPQAMGAVKAAIEQEVGEQALAMEDRMITLATAVSGAPFLGLLGTVWGVMDTFSDIAAAGSASLTTMAPGVSGALITTVTGLLVAIPAMFGYNFLVVTLRGLTVRLDNFAAEFASALEHRYVEPSQSSSLS